MAFTKPIVDLLRMFDTYRPNLGEVYEGIDSMIEKIRVVINVEEQDPNEVFYREVKDILTKRWNKMTTSLHLLAYIVNPKYYSTELLNDPCYPPISQGCPQSSSAVTGRGYTQCLQCCCGVLCCLNVLEHLKTMKDGQ